MSRLAPALRRLPAVSALRLLPAVAALSLGACSTFETKVDVLPVAAAPQYAPPPAPRAATGSLFHNASYRPGFEDRRARMVGDTLTVTIVENVTASQKSSSTVDKSGSIAAAFTALPFFGASSLAAKTKIAGSSDNSFSGKGGTESANTFAGSITATVQQVLPNGHLVIAGEKQIGVQDNVDMLRFSGTVDPRTIQPGNLVASTQVANVRIASEGKGAPSSAVAIGWLARFFLTVLPL